MDAAERERIERAVHRGEVLEGPEQAAYAVTVAQEFLTSVRGQAWVPIVLLLLAGYATVVLVVSLFSDDASLAWQLLLMAAAVAAGLAAAYGFRRRRLVLAAFDANHARQEGRR